MVVQAVKSRRQWSVCDWGCGGCARCEEQGVVGD